MLAPQPGAMSPYLCVAQHISLNAGAHRCSWLPKCSGLNATRHRATRRDTRISPGRDQHDSRDITLRGKRDAGAHANHNPGRGIGVHSAQYLLPRVRPGRRWGGGTGSDRGYWATMARYFETSFVAAIDRDLLRNLAPTRDRGACTYLDRRHGQYLAAYLTKGLHVYRYQHLVSNPALSRWRARRADRCQDRAAYHAMREQTDTNHNSGATCAPACSAIGADVVGRVAYTTKPRAAPPITVQILDAVECQMVRRIGMPATRSITHTAGQPICTAAGPQTPRHTYTQTAEPVVSQVGPRVAAWTSHTVGELMDSEIACTGLYRTEATIMDAVWRAVSTMSKSTVTVTKWNARTTAAGRLQLMSTRLSSAAWRSGESGEMRHSS